MGEDKDDGLTKGDYLRYGSVSILLIIIILSLLDVLPIMDTIGDDLVDKFRDMGVLGGFCYMLLCCGMSVICVPSSLLALAGGYIWENTVYGFLAAHPGILIGATISFLLGRLLFREWLSKEMQGNAKFTALSHATQEHGYKVVFFGRLSPVPFGLLNYALSISSISYLQFIAASFFGLIPITVGYAKVGSDFRTYFERSELRDELDKCVKRWNPCCNKYNLTCDSFYTLSKEPQFIACLEEGKECNFKTLEEEADDLNCQYNDCEIESKTTVGEKETITDTDACAMVEMMNEATSSDLDNNSCLRELNNGQLWPKIVLPVSLFITLLIVGYLGNRAMKKAGYLQVSMNLSQQKELLIAERKAQEEAEKVPVSV